MLLDNFEETGIIGAAVLGQLVDLVSDFGDGGGQRLDGLLVVCFLESGNPQLGLGGALLQFLKLGMDKVEDLLDIVEEEILFGMLVLIVRTLCFCALYDWLPLA